MINQVKFSVKTVVSLVSLSLAAVLTGVRVIECQYYGSRSL